MDEQLIEQSFEVIPEEVKSYIYSRSFSNAFFNFLETKKVKPGDQKKLQVMLISYLAQVETEEALTKTIFSISETPEKSQDIINWIQENVIQKVLELTTEKYLEEEDEEGQPASEEKVLQQEPLKERLTQKTVVPPTVRDYSIEKPAPQSTPPATRSTPDPYREIPEL